MNTSFSINGLWWLPESPKKKINGIVSFSLEKGCELELFGVFYKLDKDLPEQPKIILGMTQDNKPITLYKCINTSLTYPLFGMGKTIYYAHFLFEGVHFRDESDIQFNKLNINYSNLDAWVGINGFSIYSEQESEFDTWKIDYKKPITKVFEINDCIQVGIDFSYTGPKMCSVQTEAKITQNVSLFAKSNDGDIQFDDLDGYLRIFCYLFQISLQTILNTVQFFGFSNKNTIKNGHKKYSPKINIFYSPIEYDKNQKSLLPQDMLFVLNDLDNQLMKNWFNNFDKVKSIIPLYRSLFYKNRIFIDTKFIYISQALESIHSIKFSNNFLPDKEFKKRVKTIIASTPQDYQDWVRLVFNNANEKHFKQRIFELLEKKRDIFGDYINDFNLFALKIRDTRNFYVHQSKQKYLIEDKRELVNTIDLMVLIFESYILDLIGFTEEKISNLLEPKLLTLKTGWVHRRLRTNKS